MREKENRDNKRSSQLRGRGRVLKLNHSIRSLLYFLLLIRKFSEGVSVN